MFISIQYARNVAPILTVSVTKFVENENVDCSICNIQFTLIFLVSIERQIIYLFLHLELKESYQILNFKSKVIIYSNISREK